MQAALLSGGLGILQFLGSMSLRLTYELLAHGQALPSVRQASSFDFVKLQFSQRRVSSISYDTTNSGGEDDDGVKSRHVLHWTHNSSGVLVSKDLSRCLLIARGSSFVVDPAFKLWAGEGVDWASRGLFLGRHGGAMGGCPTYTIVQPIRSPVCPEKAIDLESDVSQPFIRSATVKRAGGLPVAPAATGWNDELHQGPAPVPSLLGKEQRIASILVTSLGGTASASHNGC